MQRMFEDGTCRVKPNYYTRTMGGIFCAASFLSITASDISDQLFEGFSGHGYLYNKGEQEGSA